MKLYWIFDKIDLKPGVCGSIKSVSKETGIKYSTLLYQFSKHKRVRYQTERYHIEVVELKRSRRPFKFKKT